MRQDGEFRPKAKKIVGHRAILVPVHHGDTEARRTAKQNAVSSFRFQVSNSASGALVLSRQQKGLENAEVARFGRTRASGTPFCVIANLKLET
jgi:hypothetical protein